MKLELKPQIDSVSSIAASASSHAGVSKDGQVRWVYKDAYLEVIRPCTNATLASWRFGKVLHDTQTSITAVTDVKSHSGLLLLVATSNVSDFGMINIFSVKLRKVIRVIEVPKRISALEVVFANETEDVSPWIVSKHLQFFSGLLAVGTEGGYIYLVDLCLDELDSSFSTETSPKSLMVITPRIVDPVGKREQAQAYDKHLALVLDEQCHRQEQFYYRRQDDSVQKVFEEDTVYVSSLSYMAQAGTLAVGFNFGCFQLWRLYNPVLDYSSRFSPDNQAVTGFVAQEPENDPRNFVYLWVVYDSAKEESISSMCLYQLSFTKKDSYANFGIFYDELESVCPRLDHRLTLDPYSSDARSTSRSTVVSCYTLRNPLYTPPAVLSDSFEEGFYGNDLSLSVFVWRADSKQGGRGSTTTHYWAAIFDMNRWYHAQMPHSLRCHGSSLQVCSFWAVYDLDDVVAQLPSHALLNVEVSGEKVLRFTSNSPVPPEEHSYPSALQLSEVEFVLADGSVQACFNGWQGQLLREMVLQGAQHLVQPADLYHQCLRARLVPQSYEENSNRSTEYQRRMLLNMSLEWGRAPALIPQCIQLWADGEFAEQGCTLSLLLSWAWDSVVNTKKSLDSTCSMLYDWSGVHLDQRTDWQIAHLTQVLSHIKQIFTFFTIQATPTTERGQLELELRQNVVSILLQHCEVVRWAISFNLLPEIDEASEPLPCLFAFPVSELELAYRNRRAELSAMKGTLEGLSLLLVDSLVECQGPHIRQVWESLGGDGTYPPPSMQAMLNMYLIEEVSVEVKHAIMLYFLQDLATLDRSAEREATVASFIQRFMLSPSLVHQVQGLWFIDHRDFEEGVRQLVNANVHEDLCDSWRHAAVVNSLLAQGEGRAATRYMHTKLSLGGTVQEQQLYISVLVDNRKVSQALEFLRGCDSEKTSTSLMSHLLRECQSHKLLGQLLQLSLRDEEERALEHHLRSRPEPHALEPLLLYYLHRSRFLQAFRLNQDMNSRDKLETSLASQERSVTRNKLMEAYLKALPEVTRRMLTEKQTAVTAATRRIQIEQPKPLSTAVRQSDFTGMSQARFIMAVIDKINEAKAVLLEEEEEEEEEEEVAQAETDRFQVDSAFDVPFLNTPRTPRHKSVLRKSELVYPGTQLSPVAAKSLSYSAKKTLTLLQATDKEEDKNSLKKLAAECLQVLQTPVRDHKKAMSPAPISHGTSIKTPQSILKVRRLSKTLPSSREKLSSRRNSGPRASKLGVSRSDTSHNASLPLPSSAAASPVTPVGVPGKVATGDVATATPKQLRFMGLSPSPTPSPAVAVSPSLSPSPATSPAVASPSLSVESEHSKEIVEKQRSVSPPPEPASSRDIDTAEEAAVTDNQEKSAAFDGDEPEEVEVHAEEPMEEASPQATCEKLEEGPIDRYSEKLKQLVRPDLQSPWKNPSPEGKVVQVDEDITFHDLRSGPAETPSNTSSPVLASATAWHKESLIVKETTEEKITITQKSEKTMVAFSQEVISSTRVEEQKSTMEVKGDQERTQEEGVNFPKPSSQIVLSSKSDSPKTPPTSATLSLLPLQVETSAQPEESPPATPPSSKRAKLMASKGDDTHELVQVKGSPSLREARRKTPERRSATRRMREGSAQSSPSPSSEREVRRRKTPDRKSPARQQKTEEEPVRKTPERKSPARKLRKLSEEKEPAETSVSILERAESPPRTRRKTPDRKSPGRKSMKSTSKDESLVSYQAEKSETEEVAEKTRVVKEIKVVEEKTSGTDEVNMEEEKFSEADKVFGEAAEPEPLPEVPVRRRSTRLNTPDRSLVDGARLEPATPTRRSQRGTTPPRQEGAATPGRKGRGNLSPVKEVSKPETEEVEEKESNEQPETQRTRRHKSKTPDRLAGGDGVDQSPARRSRRQSKTPDRLLDMEEVRAREAKTPDRLEDIAEQAELGNSRRQSKTSDRAAVDPAEVSVRKSRRQSKTPDRFRTEEMPELSVRRSKRESKTPDILEVDETEQPETTNLRKTRRQSKTPDRHPARESVEPLTSTRRSTRQHKLSSEEAESMPSSHPSPSPRRTGGDNHPEPATPPRMSAKRSEQEDAAKSVPQQPDLTGSPGRRAQGVATPVRRSSRKPKSPERLNTDEIQPVSPHTSPVRSKLRQDTSVATEKTKSQKEKSKESEEAESKEDRDLAVTQKMSEESNDEPAMPGPAFIFSPPLKHSLRSQDSQPDGGQGNGKQHKFVFSSPSVVSPPKDIEEPPAKSKRKKRRNLYNEEDVLLLEASPATTRPRGRPKKQPSDAQRATAALLKRLKKTPPKARRLVPSRKRVPSKE